jgi:pantoate--beta-alanine ligase
MRQVNMLTGFITMQIISDIKQAQNVCQKWRDKGESISFVPTMGCLHAGHLTLIEKAQSLSDHVVVSIFVNPLQFDNADDLLKYPHTLSEDIRKLADFKLDLVFTPEAGEFYAEGESQVEQIELGTITSLLEGAHRPGHLVGVATVVKRFFDLIQPNITIFGEKDFQQLMVIKQLVEKFELDIKIIGMPTAREHDGLAMSSRNIHLSEDERKKAPEIYQQLKLIKAALNTATNTIPLDYIQLEQTASDSLAAMGFVPEYVAIRETATLLSPKNYSNSKVVLVAAKLGEVRLIDNIRV